jgi:hypothetical protein
MNIIIRDVRVKEEAYYPFAHKTVKLCMTKVKVKFTLQQATKAQRGSRGIAVLFL